MKKTPLFFAGAVVLLIACYLNFAGKNQQTPVVLHGPVSQDQAIEIAKKAVGEEGKRRNANLLADTDTRVSSFDKKGKKYWEVSFISKQYHTGGVGVVVNVETGQSYQVMYLK